MNFVKLAIFQAVEFMDWLVDFTTTTTRSTKLTQKVIVHVQILTLLTYASRLLGPTAKIKDIQGQAKLSKGRKRPEDSVTAALVYWFLLRVYLLLMSGILLGQRAFTYHGNLISKSCKSRVTAGKNSKSRIMLWCPVPHHADNLGTITRHPANFGAITRHAKTLCHPPSTLTKK